MNLPWTDTPAPDITAAIAAAEAHLAASPHPRPIYVGFRGLDGSHRVYVARATELVPLPCYGYHAEGFAWGDRSPAAAELAFAILLDYLGAWPKQKVLYQQGHPALDHHVRFLREVIARLPAAAPWWLTQAQVGEWVLAQPAAVSLAGPASNDAGDPAAG